MIIYGGEKAVEDVFARVSSERGAELIRADFSRITRREFSLEGVKIEVVPYGEIVLPLIGTYQPENAMVAISAIETLRGKGYKTTDDDIVTGITSVRWPGRFEILGRDPIFILDGAHNPHAFEAMADSLRRHFGERKIVFLIGVMADKDVDSMIGFIAPLALAFYAVRPDYPRAMDAAALADKLSRYAALVSACASMSEGVVEAIGKAGKDGIVCALGSLYFSGDIRAAYDAVSS